MGTYKEKEHNHAKQSEYSCAKHGSKSQNSQCDAGTIDRDRKGGYGGNRNNDDQELAYNSCLYGRLADNQTSNDTQRGCNRLR